MVYSYVTISESLISLRRLSKGFISESHPSPFDFDALVQRMDVHRMLWTRGRGKYEEGLENIKKGRRTILDMPDMHRKEEGGRRGNDTGEQQ